MLREGTFYDCDNLENVTLSEGITSIGNPNNYTNRSGAFENCTNLNSIKLPSTLEYIGKDAFRGCTGLTSITIPDSVTSIERFAFSRWTANQTIYCEAETQPSGWNSSWKSDEVKVEWGYKPTPET